MLNLLKFPVVYCKQLSKNIYQGIPLHIRQLILCQGIVEDIAYTPAKKYRPHIRSIGLLRFFGGMIKRLNWQKRKVII